MYLPRNYYLFNNPQRCIGDSFCQTFTSILSYFFATKMIIRIEVVTDSAVSNLSALFENDIKNERHRAVALSTGQYMYVARWNPHWRRRHRTSLWRFALQIWQFLRQARSWMGFSWMRGRGVAERWFGRHCCERRLCGVGRYEIVKGTADDV